ncbi:MAG: hypothetical protein WBC05_09560 [Sedimentisphaerales bacterium]
MNAYKIFITGLVILVTTSGAKASRSKTWSHLMGTGHTNVTNLTINESSSNSYVFDSLGNSDTDSMSGITTDTSAYAAIARATGSAETKSFDLYAEAITIPDALTDSRSWYNIAEQTWTFQAADDGLVRFDFTYDFSYDLKTEVPDEWAYCDIYVDIHLYPSHLGPWDYWNSGCHTIRALKKGVSDGDDFKTQASIPISVGTIFASGETLSLWVRIQHQAGAATIVPSPPAVEATVDIDSDTLNLKSKGLWITCYIELPEGYSVEDIDIDTVALKNGDFEVGGEYGEFQTGKLMVKFPRAEVQDILEPGQVELTVTGELIDGTPFEGSDTITVIEEGT